MRRTQLHHPDVAVLAGADRDLLDVIKAVLMEEAHFHVITATVPELVMPLIEATAPGVVVLDLNLPGQSGWGILAALRQHARFCTLPVLLLSSTLEATERVAAQHDALIEPMLKPFDLDALLQRIQYLAQHKSDRIRKAQQKNSDRVADPTLSAFSHRLLLGDTRK